jgi:hypothetical protein
MENIVVSSGSGPFVYLVFFNCPKCRKLLSTRGTENQHHSDAEMRAKNFKARHECGFDGVLVGTEMLHLVELDFTEWRAAAAR